MKRFLLLCSLVTLCGCASSLRFETTEENAWFIESKEDENSRLPVYCMANKKENSASPKCYRTKLID